MVTCPAKMRRITVYAMLFSTSCVHPALAIASLPVAQTTAPVPVTVTAHTEADVNVVDGESSPSPLCCYPLCYPLVFFVPLIMCFLSRSVFFSLSSLFPRSFCPASLHCSPSLLRVLSLLVYARS